MKQWEVLQEIRNATSAPNFLSKSCGSETKFCNIRPVSIIVSDEGVSALAFILLVNISIDCGKILHNFYVGMQILCENYTLLWFKQTK